jgi:ABC-type transport system involved in cytochrome bd biosynthesis fused ATPase/permease subunit
MISNKDFMVSSDKFQYKSDEYDLAKIKNARVVQNNLIKHALRVTSYGLLFSSIVWVICPEGFGYILAPIAMILGVLFAVLTSRKYELQVEFQHIDETGLQWVTVAKASKLSEMDVFAKQVSEIRGNIT